MTNSQQTFARFVQATSRVTEPIMRRKLLWLLFVLVAFAYSSLSILRHQHFTSTAYDLGIFDQVIWHYSNFQTPYSSVRSNLLTENLLGDHFHPILILLAPIYWFTDRVEALLVAQALLFAIPIVPIYLFTEKRLGKFAGFMFALSYSIFWGIQTAVEFDFHEIAFAVPLIALAIYFVDEEKWTPYFVCLVLLLLTKENLSVLVFFFGVYLLAIRHFKQGLISMAAGVMWFFLSLKLFIPFFVEPMTTRGEQRRYYRYWNYTKFGPGPFSALATIIKNPWLVIQTLFSPAEKLQTYWYTFHPFLFLSFFSPLFLLAIPLVAERFLSDSANLWAVNFHYTAVLVPILVMSSVDGLARITRRLKRIKPAYIIIPVSCLVLLLNARMFSQFPLYRLTVPEFWRLSSSDLAGRKAIALIPPAASVTTQGPITPHLSHRRMIYVLHPGIRIPDSECAQPRSAPALWSRWPRSA